MHRRWFLTLSLVMVSLWASAQSAKAQVEETLFDLLRLPEMIAVMREEGMAYGETLGEDMFAARRNTQWTRVLSDIYDTNRMERAVRQRFLGALGPDQMEDLAEFFSSDTGQEIVSLELGARKAMVDDAVETAAREAWRSIEDSDDERLSQISAFIEANGLIDANVEGALNASLKFYAGLVDGGGLEMTEQDILSDVWSQEPETRTDTVEWLYGFLLLAYRPLSAEQMDDYIALSRSDAGRALNRALFGAFNTMYDDISFALGLAVAQQMQGQDL